VLERIPVFFTPSMTARVDSFSPSASKPMQAIASWMELGIGLSVLKPTPATLDDLYRAHDRAFVDGVLAAQIPNGFGTKAKDVAESLPWTVGAMLSAAREAIRNGALAVAPVSGFHHAKFSEASKFCTFNGLVVAALALKAEALANCIGILDFDAHYGDGTSEIIQRLGANFIKHYSAGADFLYAHQAKEFLGMIPALVASMLNCQVLLYQAGADQHERDATGDGFLSTEEMAERDRLVFETAQSLSIPVAWNLAGGYQDPLLKVLAIHDATMLAAAAVYL
jgi:acetoin utilization deacetylase AcuC-like enzyme